MNELTQKFVDVIKNGSHQAALVEISQLAIDLLLDTDASLDERIEQLANALGGATVHFIKNADRESAVKSFLIGTSISKGISISIELIKITRDAKKERQDNAKAEEIANNAIAKMMS